MVNKQLIDAAIKARELSYSPYSNFKVGAAVLTKEGKIFVGSNIENASYPLCMCAERNAVYNAYLNGYKKEDIISLAVVADTDDVCSPCGACRQVLSELLTSDCPIIMGNLKENYKIKRISELLPDAFCKEDFVK